MGAAMFVLLYLVTFTQLWTANGDLTSNEDTCVYSFQVPRQDSHAACSDSVSLDQQLLKTMVLSLQRQVAQQDERFYNMERERRNIHQCSWTNVNDEKRDGVISTCSFHKREASTVLRIVWSGGIRLNVNGAGSPACRRWFLSLNGEECQSPNSIDTQVHTRETEDSYHRIAHLEGLCREIPAGVVIVSLNIGSCVQSVYRAGNPYTGWTSTSRIIVEEINVLDTNMLN